ncbi:transposase [Aurantimonas sp. 22II-16-19i]|nr:transposase [Aurantimonas sp. 22II-16-19i]
MPLNLSLMRLIDEQFLETPWYASEQMVRHLRRRGYTVGRKRVRRLMARMGLAAIYQGTVRNFVCGREYWDRRRPQGRTQPL